MVNIINDYIHEYDFPVHSLFMEHKESIIQDFWQRINQYPGYNVPCKNKILNDTARNLFLDIIDKNYKVSESLVSRDSYGISAYVQDDVNYMDYWHNHAPSSTIVATFYVDPPDPADGGAISFLLGSEEIHVHPKPNKIYLFPYWLYHRPIQQRTEVPRICFNTSYFCRERAAHKETRVVW